LKDGFAGSHCSALSETAASPGVAGVWLRGVARRRHAGIRPLLVPGKQNV